MLAETLCIDPDVTGNAQLYSSSQSHIMNTPNFLLIFYFTSIHIKYTTEFCLNLMLRCRAYKQPVKVSQAGHYK